MFGGFTNVPRKGNESGQKPLGVIQSPGGVLPAQRPLGVVGAPSDAIPQRQQPLGVLPSAGTPLAPPDAKADGLIANEVEAVWNAVIHGWSGYAKAAREILKRAAVYARIRLADNAPWDPNEKDPGILALYKFHKSIPVSPRAPRITFMPPQNESNTGYRVIWTMMETERVHPSMVNLMNERYDECWVPTTWNARTFLRSGLRIPTYIMPLGVDPSIYSPNASPFVPKATLMTGPNAGRTELPRGFLFINVFQPSFRKGHDVLIKAFEEAFHNDPEAGLILGTTAYGLADAFPWKSMKSRIWTLPGTYSEQQLASIYKGCRVHVSTSRGEGWGLPTVEAGAVGLPVIIPKVSSYPDIVPPGCGYFFDSDSTRVFPEAKSVSPWFEGIEFADYAEKSQKQLIGLMKQVKKNYSEAAAIGLKFKAHITSKLTWSIAAKKVADRLRVICARP